MSNILINPNSGIIEFTTGTAGVSAFNTNFTGGAFVNRMSYDNYGGLNLTSYVSNITGVDRFTVDGANGRLFSVTDSLSGSLFSVNDIAGLPIIEAFDDNTVIMGAFNRNDFVLTGNALGLGGLPNTGTTKLYVSGNVQISGGLFVSGNPVLTGSSTLYATSVNLASTGSTLNSSINSLSGVSVLTFGNQTINGIKTFTTPNVSGYLNFTSGSYVSGVLNPRNNLIFSRDNSVTTGAAVSFTKTNGGSQVDYIEYPVSLTRGAIGPLYNPWYTSYFANDGTNIDWVNPRYTRWNIDGWGDLTNVRSRKYDNFVTVLQNQIGNYIVGAELIMYDFINNKYYLFKFSSWQGGGGGGGFSYVRSLISFNDPEISKISGYLAVAENTTFDSSVGFNGPVLFEGDTNHYGSNRFYGPNYFSNPSYFTSDITATGGNFTINNPYTNLNSTYLNIKANNNNISLNDGFDKNLDQFLYSITLTGAGIAEANGIWTRPSGDAAFTNGQASSNLYWSTNDSSWSLEVYSAVQGEVLSWYYTPYKLFQYGFYAGNNGTVPTITNITWRSKNVNGNSILANIGEVVLLTGNQTISGIKSFADNTVFGDPSQDNFLVISGNNFTVYGSGNFTSGLFVNGTGVLLSGQATQVDLGSTVRTTGNQTVSGVKNFQSVPLVSGKEIYFQKDIVYSSGISFTPNYVSGRNFVYQLTGFATTYNTINNPINIPEGETIIIKVIQSNYGNNFLNFGNNYRFPADASPLITQASGKFDIFNILKLDNRFITTYIKNFSN
jgi:hypothetical protein